MAPLNSKPAEELYDDSLSKAYERAYGTNPAKIAIVENAIPILQDLEHKTKMPCQVLDVGCGSGFPVSNMLIKAGMHVKGIDVSPAMIEQANTRLKGEFIIVDMLEYQPQKDSLAGIFVIFSTLHLEKYADLHALITKLIEALRPGGLLVFGQPRADEYVKDPNEYCENGTCVERRNVPFMGQRCETTMMTAEGQVKLFESMGLEIVENTLYEFQPEDYRCALEYQQYIIARKPEPLPETGRKDQANS